MIVMFYLKFIQCFSKWRHCSSQPINMNVNVYSDGSPADVSVSPSTAIEDGPAFRLPLTITLNDTSENEHFEIRFFKFK